MSVLAFSVYFYRVTKPRTWLRRIVLVILAQAVVLLIGTTRQEYLLIIGVIIAGLGFFCLLVTTLPTIVNDGLFNCVDWFYNVSSFYRS